MNQPIDIQKYHHYLQQYVDLAFQHSDGTARGLRDYLDTIQVKGVFVRDKVEKSAPWPTPSRPSPSTATGRWTSSSPTSASRAPPSNPHLLHFWLPCNHWLQLSTTLHSPLPTDH